MLNTGHTWTCQNVVNRNMTSGATAPLRYVDFNDYTAIRTTRVHRCSTHTTLYTTASTTFLSLLPLPARK